MARKTSGKPTPETSNAGGMPPVSEKSFIEVAGIFKLLSDETRLKIVLHLAQSSELHVTGLCERLGQSQPAVSHHLALLRVSGLIESRRDGKHNYYSIRKDYFGELLLEIFGDGNVPDRLKFQRFALAYSGN